MSFTLYELNESYMNVIELIESGLEEEGLQALEQIEEQLEIKADNYATIIKRLDAVIEMIKTEEKRLYDRRKGIENSIKNMKLRLEESMIIQNKRKIKTDKFSFNIQKNPVSLRIINEKEVPEEFKKIEIKIDNTKLKEAIKNGLEVEYAVLEQLEGLRIR